MAKMTRAEKDKMLSRRYGNAYVYPPVASKKTAKKKATKKR